MTTLRTWPNDPWMTRSRRDTVFSYTKHGNDLDKSNSPKIVFVYIWYVYMHVCVDEERGLQVYGNTICSN